MPQISATAAAQTFSAYGTSTYQVSPRVKVSFLEGRFSDKTRAARWIQLVVLWRGQPDWATPRVSVDPMQARRATDEYRRVQAAAVVANAVVVGDQDGGVAYSAEVDSARTTVTVFGHRLALPPGDSALIVLVDRVDRVGGDPVVAGTAVVNGQLPYQPPARTWISGDTTFVVNQREDIHENMAKLLRLNPTVAAFWH